MFLIQVKMARAALGLGVRELADLAKVAPDTIARLERGEVLKERTVDAIRTALEVAGVEFIAANGGGPGVRLKATFASGKPKGPATDAVKEMDTAIEKDRRGGKPRR